MWNERSMPEESVTAQSQVALVIVIHHERAVCTPNTRARSLGIIITCKPTVMSGVIWCDNPPQPMLV